MWARVTINDHDNTDHISYILISLLTPELVYSRIKFEEWAKIHITNFQKYIYERLSSHSHRIDFYVISKEMPNASLYKQGFVPGTWSNYNIYLTRDLTLISHFANPHVIQYDYYEMQVHSEFDSLIEEINSFGIFRPVYHSFDQYIDDRYSIIVYMDWCSNLNYDFRKYIEEKFIDSKEFKRLIELRHTTGKREVFLLENKVINGKLQDIITWTKLKIIN